MTKPSLASFASKENLTNQEQNALKDNSINYFQQSNNKD